jgi:ABC-type sugar transport system permease subunit
MWALKAFDVIWVLTRGGPLDRTMVLNVYAYQQTFQFFNFGYGAAIAYLVTFLILGLTGLYFLALRGFDT